MLAEALMRFPLLFYRFSPMLIHQFKCESPRGTVAQGACFCKTFYPQTLRSSKKRLREVAQAVAQDEAFRPGWYSTVAQGCALRRKRLRKVCGIFLDIIFLDICFFYKIL